MKRPPSIVKELNEPNMALMAKAFRNLYYKSIKQDAKKSAHIKIEHEMELLQETRNLKE